MILKIFRNIKLKTTSDVKIYIYIYAYTNKTVKIHDRVSQTRSSDEPSKTSEIRWIQLNLLLFSMQYLNYGSIMSLTWWLNL